MAWDWLDDSLLGNAGETTNAALRNPITNFNFVLEVEALYFLALKGVKVFNKENEYEYIREGGVNDYVHMRRKPISKPFTFQVERYVGNERFLDPLALGSELMLPVILYVYRYQPRQAVTESAPAWPARLYTFTGCTVTAKEYGELNAEKSGLLTETTTIAYRELVVVTNPTWGPDAEKPRMNEFKEGVAPINADASHFVDKDNYTRKDFKFDNGETHSIWVKNEDVKAPRKYIDYVSDPIPEWAKKTNVETENKNYETVQDEDGVWHMVRKDDGGLYTKPRIDEYSEETMPKWASDKSVRASAQSYTTETDMDGTRHRIRVPDGEQFTKNPKTYEDYTKDSKPTWASGKNMEGDTELYKLEPDKDGVNHIVRKPDGDRYTKEAWSMQDNKDDPQPKHSRKSPTDDSKPEVKGPWSMQENKDNPQPAYAEKSPTDDSRAEVKGPWSIKENKENPQPKYAEKSKTDDSKPEAKEPWDMKGNKTNPKNKHAAASPTDSSKPEVKGPWSIKSPDAGKNAAQSPKDSSKPEVKGPWSIKSPGSSKNAVQSPTDSSKPETKGPWDIKANTKDPKPQFATASPKDGEKPEAVKWPPTRRALMAQTLSDKK